METNPKQKLLADAHPFRCRAAMKLGLCVGTVALFSGCTHLGPKTVAV